MKDSRAFGHIAALLLGMLSVSAHAYPVMEVGDIEVTEDRYAEKVIRVTIHYDGSLGQSAGLGVMAVTHKPIKGTVFSPYSVSKGDNEVLLNVTRPDVAGDVSFDSHSLEFQIYSLSARDVRKERVGHVLYWPSVEEYFDFGELPIGNSPYETITSIGIDEALGDIGPVVRDVHAGGVETSNIRIFYSAMHTTSWSTPATPGEQAALVVPETTSAGDVKRLVGSLAGMGINKLEFKVVAINEEGFELGEPLLGDPALIHGVVMRASEIAALIDEGGLAALYGAAGMEQYDREKSFAELLNKAIDLNERRNNTSGLAAREIVEYLIAVGYENTRIYSQLAASHCCTHNSLEEALRQRRAIHNLALSINPEDQWVHAQLAWDEAARGDYESAERHAELAVKYATEQNVWNINNYGRLYALQGRNQEAREKYDALRGLKALNAANQRAHREGLSDYAELLVSMNDPLADAVYEELVTTYPGETACKQLEYAGYLASMEPTSKRARALLTDRNVQNCRGYASVLALVEVLDWHRQQGSDIALRKALLRHEDLGMLLYSLASVDDGADVLRALSQQGVDLATPAGNGFNALHIAVLTGDQAALDAVLQAGIDIDAMSQEGFTALMLAVYQENVQMAGELLRRGARVDVKSKQGYTVIDMVAGTSNEAIKSLFARSST